MRRKLYFTVILSFVAYFAKAQIEGNEVLGFQISGYADAYWQTKFHNNKSEVLDRSFYTEAETFALGNANFTVSKELGKAGAVVQLGFGPRAIAANGEYPNIQQLYIYYNLSDVVKLTMGNFGTFVGYEVIDAPANFHYSTSLLFQNGPFFHTGLKADFALGEKFAMMFGVFNETDSKVDLDGRFVNFGGQFSFMPSESSNIYLNWIYGGVSDGNDHKRGQIDLVADTQLGETYLALNGSYQFNSFEVGDNAGWWGIAGYAQQAFSDQFAMGLRAEYFDDKDGYAGVAGGSPKSSVIDLTLSAPYSIDGFRIVPELRLDLANKEYFPLSDGTLSKTQFTAGAAVMYSF